MLPLGHSCLLLRLNHLLIKVLLCEKLIYVISCEVIAEEFIIDGGTHEDDSHSGVLSDEALYG